VTNSAVKLSQITKIYSGSCSEDNKKMIIESVRNQKPKNSNFVDVLNNASYSL